jgi:hypothetical protein
VPLINDIRNFCFVVIIVLLMITGCTSFGPVQMKQPKPLTPEILSSQESGWWSARFRIDWPPDTEASWYVDLLLAHQVVLPVLGQHKDTIALWRFHRRAARDDTGHQFSFIFYASPSKAYDIFEALMNDPLLEQLKFSGLIIDDAYDDPGIVSKPNIEDTSDSHWSAIVRKNWPYYIMGVSQMWLNMVTDTAAELPEGNQPATISELEEFYQEINARLIEIWRRQGRHAFLHHLNALFGYEPLIYYDKRFLSF